MTLIVHRQLEIIPSNSLQELSGLNDKGPYWVSIQYWVHKHDLDSEAGFVCNIEFTDPANNVQLIGGPAIGLFNPNGSYSVPIQCLRSLENSNPVILKTELYGDPGDSLVSYEISVIPVQYEWENLFTPIYQVLIDPT